MEKEPQINTDEHRFNPIEQQKKPQINTDEHRFKPIEKQKKPQINTDKYRFTDQNWDPQIVQAVQASISAHDLVKIW